MTIEEVKKKCTGECKKIKPLTEFNRDKTRKDGRKSQCRKCTNKTRPSRAKVQAPAKKKRVNCMEGWWKDDNR